MIQYIVAAGLGALVGSTQKDTKKYKKGGEVMKKDPATKRQILRESDGIMDDADDLIRIADKKRLDRDDKMGIQTLADEMKFRAGNIYDTAQRKLAKGGATDDLGNPTDPSVIQEMEVFIEKEIPKLDEDRYFTYGMKRKEAKRRFYEKHGYGAYGMDFGFAKGGTTDDAEERAFAEYMDDYGVDREEAESQFLGEFDSKADWAAEFVADTGGMESLIDPERFYRIDKVGFREWAINMADAMVGDIDEDNVEEYASNLMIGGYEEAEEQGGKAMEDFVSMIQEEEADAIISDLIENHSTADEIINNLGPNYGMGVDDLENAYLIIPDYDEVADALEDDGYVFIEEDFKTFVFDTNMARGGRTKRMEKGGQIDKSTRYAFEFRLDRAKKHLDEADIILSRNGDHQGAYNYIVAAHIDGIGMKSMVKRLEGNFYQSTPAMKGFLDQYENIIEDLIIHIEDVKDIGRYNPDRALRSVGQAQRVLASVEGEHEKMGRRKMARGGAVNEGRIPVPKEVLDGKDFMAVVVDNKNGKYHMKFSKTYRGAMTMARNMTKKFDNQEYHVQKFDPYYGATFDKAGIYIEPTKSLFPMEKGGCTSCGKRGKKMEDGGMVEYLLYGVKQGKPDYMEEILFIDDKPIKITDKLRDLATAKGFDRLRTSIVDLRIAPDFTKGINFKRGGSTSNRKEVSKFDKLAMKVAARYRSQGKSREEAMKIGRGTAGKVYREQQSKKRKK